MDIEKDLDRMIGGFMHTNFDAICCPECGVHFGIPSAYLEHLKSIVDKTFWCLNGHELSVYAAQSDESELRLGEVRGENEMLQAQVRAKDKALKDAQEELKIMRGVAKQRRIHRPREAA